MQACSQLFFNSFIAISVHPSHPYNQSHPVALLRAEVKVLMCSPGALEDFSV